MEEKYNLASTEELSDEWLDMVIGRAAQMARLRNETARLRFDAMLADVLAKAKNPKTACI